MARLAALSIDTQHCNRMHRRGWKWMAIIYLMTFSRYSFVILLFSSIEHLLCSRSQYAFPHISDTSQFVFFSNPNRTIKLQLTYGFVLLLVSLVDIRWLNSREYRCRKQQGNRLLKLGEWISCAELKLVLKAYWKTISRTESKYVRRMHSVTISGQFMFICWISEPRNATHHQSSSRCLIKDGCKCVKINAARIQRDKCILIQSNALENKFVLSCFAERHKSQAPISLPCSFGNILTFKLSSTSLVDRLQRVQSKCKHWNALPVCCRDPPFTGRRKVQRFLF